MIVTLYYAYKIVLARKMGVKFRDMKKLTIPFFVAVVCLWLIKIYVGFIQYWF